MGMSVSQDDPLNFTLYMINTWCTVFFRTVEVNNTDAEGRLVLGDGVSFQCFVPYLSRLID